MSDCNTSFGLPVIPPRWPQVLVFVLVCSLLLQLIAGSDAGYRPNSHPVHPWLVEIPMAVRGVRGRRRHRPHILPRRGALRGGLRLLARARDDVPDEVRYIRAGDAAGNSWGGSVLVTSSNSGYRSCALIEMAGGLPGVFYSTFATQGYTMLRAYLSLSETATGGPWGEGFAVFTSNSTEDFRQLDPLNLAGRPALGCIGERWEGTAIHNAVFAQAATADGTAWTDGQTVWHCGVNGNADFTSLGTMPVAVIYDDLDKAIYFAAYY